MPKPTGRPRGRPPAYDQETIDLALTLTILQGGNYKRAAALLYEQTRKKISDSTIARWVRDKHADRYDELQQQLHAQVAQRVAAQAEQIMQQAGELERRLLEKIEANMDGMTADQAATALRNVSTTKALNNDKISAPIRGRPNVITEHRSADEIMRQLERLGVLKPDDSPVIEGQAVEISERAAQPGP